MVQADLIDTIIAQWKRERADLEFSSMEIIGRLLRTATHVESALEVVFKQFGLDFGLFDVLASLRRQGAPYQLPPSELNQWCMLTSGAMTKRLDRLEGNGLLRRKADLEDRRGVLVTLTPAGVALVEQVLTAHLLNENRVLADLARNQRVELGSLLRHLLVYLESGAEARQTKRPNLGVIHKTDLVDTIIAQWKRERPDLDCSPMEVIGRVLRTARHVNTEIEAVFKQFGLDFGLFDVLASLRRQGAPYQLPPSELNRWCMLTSGAMTKRLDRLEGNRLLRRKADLEDRRGVLVELTSAGFALTEKVLKAHLLNENRLLAPLARQQRVKLSALLRRLLYHFEDAKRPDV